MQYASEPIGSGCGFTAVSIGLQKVGREMGPELMFRDIPILQEKYDDDYFYFIK